MSMRSAPWRLTRPRSEPISKPPPPSWRRKTATVRRWACESRRNSWRLISGVPHSGCHLPEEIADDPRHDGPQCAAASRYCNITSAGDVMACNILPGSGGNIRHRAFRDVWESSPWLNEVRSIRRRHLHTCGSCSKISYCGRCHAQALVEDGDLYGPIVLRAAAGRDAGARGDFGARGLIGWKKRSSSASPSPSWREPPGARGGSGAAVASTNG